MVALAVHRAIMVGPAGHAMRHPLVVLAVWGPAYPEATAVPASTHRRDYRALRARVVHRAVREAVLVAQAGRVCRAPQGRPAIMAPPRPRLVYSVPAATQAPSAVPPVAALLDWVVVEEAVEVEKRRRLASAAAQAVVAVAAVALGAVVARAAPPVADRLVFIYLAAA